MRFVNEQEISLLFSRTMGESSTSIIGGEKSPAILLWDFAPAHRIGSDAKLFSPV